MNDQCILLQEYLKTQIDLNTFGDPILKEYDEKFVSELFYRCLFIKIANSEKELTTFEWDVFKERSQAEIGELCNNVYRDIISEYEKN